ncbi:MAG: hypothetical protein LBD07_00765 [Spirochaetaceae bacterium]|jgi:DNA repair exonuclease SbcCD ATPase subunit|nr:hypothetical protein [Spirochaetaceae bacterium]
MGIFSLGNILVIVIFSAILVVFRLIDRKNRNIQAARNYGKQLEEKLKEQLAQYVEKKKNEITNYGALLAADKSAAKAVLTNIEAKAAEFTGHIKDFDSINRRLGEYDVTLSELLKMTDRVEDNLRRISAESDFVENIARNVAAAKEKYESVLSSINSAQTKVEISVADSLKTIETYIDAGRTRIEETLENQNKEFEKNFKVQQERIEAAEKDREENLKRDVNLVNALLKDAVDNAGARAGKLEDEIYQGFIKQTEERTARIKAEIDDVVSDVKNQAHSRIDALDKDIDAELRELRVDSKELRASASEITALEKQIKDSADEINSTMAAQKERVNKAIAAQKSELAKIAGDAKNTAAALDAELRLQLESAQENIKKQIAVYENEAGAISEKVTAEFNSSIDIIKTKLHDIETEIEKIKREAYGRISDNINLFEDDFAESLVKRAESIESRFVEWRDAFNAQLNTITEQQEADYRKIEVNFSENLRKKTAELDVKLVSGMEHINGIAACIEDEARKQMEDAGTSIAALREQIKEDLTELRESTITQADTEIKRHTLEITDKLKNNFREIENEQKIIFGNIEGKNVEINELLVKSRKEIEETFAEFNADIKEITEQIATINDGITRYKQEMITGVDQNAKNLEASIMNAEEKIAGFIEQSKLIDKTMEMKNTLTREIEDITGDLQRLELQRSGIANLESQFTKVKRMEDEVNVKMARFLNEQRRIELMEEGFNKLLRTASSVDEKLASLTENDDSLQDMQLKFRKLLDVMNETEEKYQRIEKKNQILDATNEGIDRNFKSLQESEKTAKQFAATANHLSSELAEIKTAVDNLMQQNSKALEASEKLTTLDSKLGEIEERIADMQKARQWLADLEGRINSVYSEAKDQVKLAGDLLKKEGVKLSGDGGAPTLSQREQVVSLKRQGWTADEIARTLKISKGSVELILEMASRER